MSLFMESTDISPERTVGEIQAVLARAGADAILMEYEDRSVKAVSFKFKVGANVVPFRLPCRWEAIALTLRKRGKISDADWNTTSWQPAIKRRVAIETKAKRVAWRQILRWIQAQLALVETDMVSLEEVFMPYVQISATQTLFDKISANGFQLEHKP